MRAWPCEAYLSPEIAKTIESFAVWRLEGKQWEQAEGEAALAVHPLGEDSRAILTQSTADGYLGTLYLESGDKRTRVAEDVTLSVPTPTR